MPGLISRLLRPLALLASLALPAAAAAQGLSGAPAPFDEGGVKVALISYISGGDFFQAYEAGAKRQAKALGIDLRIFPGRQDAAQQREQLQQAIDLGVDGVILNHGTPEALKDLAQQALDAGIAVVAFDVDLGLPKAVQVEQGDAKMARLVLDRMLADNGPSFTAGYVYVPGFAPLERRDAVWTEVKRANPGIREAARWGVVDGTTAASVASQTAAALRANPGITAIFAPYDEFARGAMLGAQEAGVADHLRIYSSDISTADIEAMREPGSPWVATAATNPASVGEVTVRAAALAIAGEPVGPRVTVEPVLITREQLEREKVRSVEDLNARLPGFARSPAAQAPWIPLP